jgi:hypothetical protein
MFLGAAKFSFFLIIIKSQTTTFYIDIVPFGTFLVIKSGTQDKVLMTLQQLIELKL